jgi:diguanylate cyclase (GGDEF)-like protein
MRRRLDQLLECHRRYEQSFALVVFDVEGPGTRDDDDGGGRQTALAVVGAALGDSVRLVDETFRLEEDALCVLAPGQDTIGGVQMAERLLRQLDELERAGGLRIGISAGVVACPEHGNDADALLHKADEAMWRARSVGQPVGVGALAPHLQDR